MKITSENSNTAALLFDQEGRLDQVQLNKLLQEINLKLVSYARRHVESLDEAREMVAHARERATVWSQEGKFRGKTSDEVIAWLFRVVQNKSLDHNKQSDRRDQLLKTNADKLAPVKISVADRVTIGVDFERALDTLPQEHRQALFLSNVMGLSMAEGAHALKLSGAAYKSLLYRARSRMRSQLADYA